MAYRGDTAAHGSSDLHLLIDGKRLDALAVNGLEHSFRLRPPVHSIRLVSRSAVPRSLGLNADVRRLGVMVMGLRAGQGGAVRDIPMGSADLLDGFHDLEQSSYRWTNGDAGLPAALIDCGGCTREVTLTVVAQALPDYGAVDQRERADAALFGAFENLGANCEFALAQRHFGVEPTSLLRWASTSSDKLCRGLETRFDGLGDPDATELAWTDTPPEYSLRDQRYLRVHTFQGRRCADPDEENALKLRGCARLRLLRRKLLDDIGHARRVFVFAGTEPSFDLDRLLQLHGAFRRVGPGVLLGVMQTADEHRVGTVERLRDGLLLGLIDRFVLLDGPYDVWRSICLQASMQR